MFWGNRHTVAEIVEKFIEANKGRWKVNPDERTSNLSRYQFVTNKYLLPKYGSWNADKFRRADLRAIRDQMIAEGNLNKPCLKKAKSTINWSIQMIFLIFEWAANADMISDDTLISLAHLRPLRNGDEGVTPTKKILSVPEEDVMETIKYLHKPVADMVRVHWFTGMRSSEVCNLRKCDITIEDSGLWRYQPYTHKTDMKGKERIIFLGPKCIEILQPYYDACVENEFMFSPLKTMEYINRNAKNRSVWTRKFGDHYNASTYYYAIRQAVLRSGVPYWYPHQLRHSFATIMTNTYGAESAKESLGHSTVRTTEGYIDPSYDRAREIAIEVS